MRKMSGFKYQGDYTAQAALAIGCSYIGHKVKSHPNVKDVY